ncbi:MAG: tRNA (adenosine(37)-N6)-dimethylallyltransferase MiaA [Armatimonadota bacterium]
MPLLVIAGPTAAGKTEAALCVAEEVSGEIVSADSMQIYKYMDIGTAKPTPRERSRAPIHLVDFVDPREGFTVVDFQQRAEAHIQDIAHRGRLPILCGGTGLYIKSIIQHMDFPPELSDEEKAIRKRLHRRAEEVGSAALHVELADIDPEAAAKIEPQDTRRIIRALEVIASTGQLFSAQQSVDDSPDVVYNLRQYVVTRPRELLYEGIETRVDRMLEAGWLAEVKELREMGLTREDQSMKAIGYRHLLAYLDGKADWDSTIEDIKRDTRRFAKRQLTWFRSGDYEWLEWGTPAEFENAVEVLKRTGHQLRDRALGE